MDIIPSEKNHTFGVGKRINCGVVSESPSRSTFTRMSVSGTSSACVLSEKRGGLKHLCGDDLYCSRKNVTAS